MSDLSADDVRDILRGMCPKRGDQKRLAEKLGIHYHSLWDVMSGRREPGASILKLLKLEKTIVYRKQRQ